MISIIVPVYNAEQYVAECIESVERQTISDYELVLVDDGSTDRSLEICRRFADENPRIRVYKQENRGAFYARKLGLERAMGDYVWFVDADDYIAEDSIRIVGEMIQSYHPEIVQFGYEEVSDVGQPIKTVLLPNKDGYYDKPSIVESVLPTMFYSDGFIRFGVNPGLWNKVILRSLIVAHYKEINKKVFMGEDGLVTYQCYLNATSLYIANQAVLYYYRKNDASVCNTANFKDYIGQNIALFSEWREVFKKEPEASIVERSFASYVFFMMWKALESTMNSLVLTSSDSKTAVAKMEAFSAANKEDCVYPYLNKATFNNITIKRKVLNYLYKHGCFRILYTIWKIAKGNKKMGSTKV